MTLADRLRHLTELATIEPYPGKSCGGCTACCSVIPVREIGTKAWQRCPHVRTPPSTEVGCGIYPRRPNSCRAWACGWLASDWPDDVRPDRCGVIVDPAEDVIRINHKEMVACRIWVLPGHQEAWHDDPVHALILSIVDAGFAVLWDMAPQPDGARLSRVFRLNPQTGRLEVGPAQPHTGMEDMTEAQRYIRAQQLAREIKPGGGKLRLDRP